MHSPFPQKIAMTCGSCAKFLSLAASFLLFTFLNVCQRKLISNEMNNLAQCHHYVHCSSSNHLFFCFFLQLGEKFIENPRLQVELKAPAQNEHKWPFSFMIVDFLPQSKLLLLIIWRFHWAKGWTSLQHEAQQSCKMKKWPRNWTPHIQNEYLWEWCSQTRLGSRCQGGSQRWRGTVWCLS